jgi:hypothetical protein
MTLLRASLNETHAPPITQYCTTQYYVCIHWGTITIAEILLLLLHIKLSVIIERTQHNTVYYIKTGDRELLYTTHSILEAKPLCTHTLLPPCVVQQSAPFLTPLRAVLKTHAVVKDHGVRLCLCASVCDPLTKDLLLVATKCGVRQTCVYYMGCVWDIDFWKVCTCLQAFSKLFGTLTQSVYACFRSIAQCKMRAMCVAMSEIIR